MGFDPSTTKPEIDFPGDSAPTDLVIEDLVQGDGAQAKAGDSISAHYVGVAHSTGEEFERVQARQAGSRETPPEGREPEQTRRARLGESRGRQPSTDRGRGLQTGVPDEIHDGTQER